MKIYKKILSSAFLVLALGLAINASAQEDFLVGDPQPFLKQLFGNDVPTTTEKMLEFLFKQQQEVKTSGAFIEVEPEFPGPREEVKMIFSSYSFDVNSSYIYWTHNGKVVLSGRGEKVYRFTAGDVGASEQVTLLAVIPGGEEFKTSKTFHIGGVDLLLSAATVIPPEYRGKALPSPRSLVYVTAFPQFILGRQSLSPSSLIYEWSLNDKEQFSKSGANKRTFSFYSSVAAGAVHEVSVRVSNLDKTIVSQKSIELTARDPEIFIYEELASGGPNMARAIKSFNMFVGEEKEFRALPYFFSKSNAADTEYLWSAGGAKVRDDGRPDILRLKILEDAAGFSNISVAINNLKNIIQRARASFTVNIF